MTNAIFLICLYGGAVFGLLTCYQNRNDDNECGFWFYFFGSLIGAALGAAVFIAAYLTRASSSYLLELLA